MAVKVDEQTEILRYEWKLLHKKLCEKPLTKFAVEAIDKTVYGRVMQTVSMFIY